MSSVVSSFMLMIAAYSRLFSCWIYLFLGSFHIQILNELCLLEYWRLIFYLSWVHVPWSCSSSSFFSCFHLIFPAFHLNLGTVYYTFQMFFSCYCLTFWLLFSVAELPNECFLCVQPSQSTLKSLLYVFIQLKFFNFWFKRYFKLQAFYNLQMEWKKLLEILLSSIELNINEMCHEFSFPSFRFQSVPYL